MRTEDDLRAAYTYLAASAPTADHAPPPITPPPRHRRPAPWPAAAAVAAGVVAVAVVVPWVTARSTPSPAAPSPVPIVGSPSNSAGTVTIVSTVTVSSSPAATTAGPPVESVASTPTDSALTEDGATNTFQPVPAPVTGSGAAVRLPFTLGYLPAGVRTVSATSDGAVGLADAVGVQAGAPFDTAMTLWVANISDPDLVFCRTSDSGTTLFERTYTIITIGQHRGCTWSEKPGGPIEGLQIDLDEGHVEVLFDDQHFGAISQEELIKMVTAITVAPSFDDESTWFDWTLSN